MPITFSPIGTIQTPFKTKANMPIQPKGAKGVVGTIVLNEDLVPALADLYGFSHIVLIYQFHKSSGFELKVKPFLDTVMRGLFATRAPRRPNAIGLSVVKLISIKNNILTIENVDMLDSTPLLDIKPYVPEFDAQNEVKIGWLSNKIKGLDTVKSDNRFSS